MSEANNLNYASSYGQSLVSLWPGRLYFAELWNTANCGKFRWQGGKAVLIPTITTTGRVDADRDTIDTAARNYENAWETKSLKHHRKWSTLIHPLDIDQTNYAANIGNITEAFNVNEKFPEMDAYMISKLYSLRSAAGGGIDDTPLNTGNVMNVFDGMMEKMNEARVPLTGRILYVTPAVLTMLKNADALIHTREVSDSANGISRTVNTLDGVKVVMVPASLMKSEYEFGEGWTAAEDALQIQMLLVHPDAVIAPISYQFAQLDPPGAYTEGKYLYFEESCEDVFIINSKIAGVQIAAGSISPAQDDGDDEDDGEDEGGEGGGEGGNGGSGGSSDEEEEE